MLAGHVHLQGEVLLESIWICHRNVITVLGGFIVFLVQKGREQDGGARVDPVTVTSLTTQTIRTLHANAFYYG